MSSDWTWEEFCCALLQTYADARQFGEHPVPAHPVKIYGEDAVICILSRECYEDLLAESVSDPRTDISMDEFWAQAGEVFPDEA